MPREQVPLDLIDDNPWNPRKYYKPAEVHELAESIEIHGQLETPQARRKDGRVQIAFGGKRKRAFLFLQKKDPQKWATQSLDIEELTDDQMFFFGMEENERRSGNTPLEKARAIDNWLTTHPEMTEEEAGHKVGLKTQGAVSNMRRVLRLPQLFLDKVDEGTLNFTMARELLVLEGLDDAKELMSEVLLHVNTTGTKSGYNVKPATVEGIQAAIHEVCKRHLKSLTKSNWSGWGGGEDPLFNVEPCLSCPRMLKTHPDKASVALFCKESRQLVGTVLCWDSKQQAAKDAAAAAAREKMRADVIEKFAPAAPSISEEIPEPKPGESIMVSQAFMNETVARSFSDIDRKQVGEPFTFHGKTFVCVFLAKMGDNIQSAGCFRFLLSEEVGKDHVFKRVKWDGHNYALIEPQVWFQAAGPITKPAEDLTPVAQARTDMDEAMALAQEKAGTRAQVLDLKDITIDPLSGYNQRQFLRGYDDLDLWRTRMDNPEECFETCTTGFHYCYNSVGKVIDGKPAVYNICSNPDCLAKKKGAYTRAKNAEGLARKNTERKLIKQVLDRVATGEMGVACLKLTLLAQMKGSHTSRFSDRDSKSAFQWLWDRLSSGTQGTMRTEEALWQLIDKLKYHELARVVAEFCFYSLQDHNTDTGAYEVKTALPLSWFEVDLEKEAAKEAASGQVR
jgi:ParB/RepB/Spo0J family partition protein